ncbi:hypothetical protein Pla8534_55710 [Lignipirellula cremea]|uniref:Uncharacterized protein n=1 Tax=Lignipirellula cremea TaxID=2528010 RepID=A0A518E0W1_9BACT|nr:hypothetical protein Pla8534_55710 [Lignipirellula cremea]
MSRSGGYIQNGEECYSFRRAVCFGNEMNAAILVAHNLAQV